MLTVEQMREKIQGLGELIHLRLWHRNRSVEEDSDSIIDAAHIAWREPGICRGFIDPLSHVLAVIEIEKEQLEDDIYQSVVLVYFAVLEGGMVLELHNDRIGRPYIDAIFTLQEGAEGILLLMRKYYRSTIFQFPSSASLYKPILDRIEQDLELFKTVTSA